jgi:Ca2+-binding RTX toxin-like protein
MTINVVIGQTFNGTTGQDNYTGGSGNDGFFMTADDWTTDTLNGGAGNDTVNYSRSTVGVDITLTDPSSAGGDSGGTVEAHFETFTYSSFFHRTVEFQHDQTVANLINIENATGSNFDDVLNGNSGNNVLSGLNGNDVINGGGGNDTIIGGGGHDTMTGGTGNDTFVFQHASDSPWTGLFSNIDTITDFTKGQDKIDLSGLVNDTTGHHALTFVPAGDIASGGTFSGVAGQVVAGFIQGQGFLVSVDLDGDKHADFQIMVDVANATENNPLTATDFIL